MVPKFPNFKTIELADRDYIREIFWKYPSNTSEMTFTNLYIWWSYYKFRWCMYSDCLIVLCNPLEKEFFLFPPIGQGNRREPVRFLLNWLRDEKGESQPRIERADERLVNEVEGSAFFQIEPLPDHFDYVYRTEDLIRLEGRKYHSKKNRINKFLRNHTFEYKKMHQGVIKACIEVLKKWCDWRECEKNPFMRAEVEAVIESLSNFELLNLKGGVIYIKGKIAAFTLGELLNPQTAVVHVEKADPEIPELFSVINQQFCENQWADVPFINREQDLGEPGLRRAKMSYQPVQLIKKFRIGLKEVR